MVIAPVQLDSVDARSFESLRSGSLLFFKVVRNTGDSAYSVLLNGKLLEVQSRIPLKPGFIYKARIIKTGGGIRFRVLDDLPTEDRALKNLSLPDTELFKEISRSLINAGLAVDSSNIEAVRRGLSFSGRKDRFLISLLAVMLDKDIPLTEETILPLSEYRGGSNNSPQGWGRDDHDHRDEQEENGQVVDEEGTELKRYVLRGDNDRSLIKYFNHKKGRHGNWFIIPIMYGNEKVGILRINTGFDKKLESLSISFYGDSHWEISVGRKDKAYRMRVYADRYPPERQMNAKLAELKEKLHKKGMEIDDIKREESPSGGFGKIFDSRKGIDAVV